MKSLPYSLPADENKKSVLFFFVVECGDIYIRSQNDNISFAIYEAGGKGIHTTDGFISMHSTIVEKELLQKLGKSCDVIIYNYAAGGKQNSLDELISSRNLEILKDFKAYQTGDIFSTCKNFYQVLDDFEEIVCDINRILYGKNIDDTLKYFFRLK